METELVDLVGRLFWVDLGFLSPTTSLLLEAVVTLRLGPSWNRLLRLSSTAPRRRPAQNGQQVRSRAAQEKECHRSRRRCRRPRRYPTGRAAKKDARTSPTVVARQELSKMERGVLYHTILYHAMLHNTIQYYTYTILCSHILSYARSLSYTDTILCELSLAISYENIAKSTLL